MSLNDYAALEARALEKCGCHRNAGCNDPQAVAELMRIAINRSSFFARRAQETLWQIGVAVAA